MKEEEFPVLLTKAEALQFAAQRMRALAQDITLTKMVLDAIGTRKLDPITEAELQKARQKVPHPELMIAACEAAANEIHALALEERVFAARQKV